MDEYFETEPSFSEVEGYPPQLPREMIAEAKIGMDEIFAVRSLIMEQIRTQARTTVTDTVNKRYGACMLDIVTIDTSQEANIYDGTTDTYLTCQVKEPEDDQQRMVVRFVTAKNSRELRLANNQEVYQFDWLSNGNRAAWYDNRIVQNMGNVSQWRSLEVRPIDSKMCIDLQQRMHEHAERVVQRLNSPPKRYIP